MPKFFPAKYTDAEAVAAAKADADISDAIAKKHTQGTDNLSRARAYREGSQSIPAGAAVRFQFTVENYDTQEEMDISIKAGTASATSASHLIDTTLNPFAAGDVGRAVWNTTDGTYATITVFNSASDVTISADIFVSGEGYSAYFSRFTAKVAGYYQVNTSVYWSGREDQKAFGVYIYKNGAIHTSGFVYMSGTVEGNDPPVSDIVYLGIGGYLDIYAVNGGASAHFIIGVPYGSFVSIHKLS